MFYIEGNPILADDLAILMELKNQLLINGIDKFAKFKVGIDNIQFTCPIHNDGQEKKPSCGITIKNKPNLPSGFVHCFTCGYTAPLEKMISDCFNKDDNGAFGKEWLIKNFLTVSVENRSNLELNFNRNNNKKVENYITEEELDSYRFYHPYMYKRKLTNEIIEKFDIGYDDNFKLLDKDGKIKGTLKCITFPVKDINGNTLFIARRSISNKIFHYPEGVNKPVYGLYELPEDVEEIIICESIINALTCYIYGKPAVALLGLGTEYQYNQLKNLKCRKFITALDPDIAGNKATERLKINLRKNKIITSYQLNEGKDINDLEKEEFNNLQEFF